MQSGISTEKLIEWYNAAHLYVHAGTVELECMSALEAIACGLPPVISNAKTSAASQFSLDDRSVFDSENYNDLTNKIDYWIENPQELLAAKKAYTEYAKKFSIDKSVDSLMSVYQQTIANACLEQMPATENSAATINDY